MQAPAGGPTYETLQDELELVISRHHDLFRETPGYCAAMLIQEADYQRDVHGADLDLRVEGDGIFVLDIGDSNAILGAGDDPEKLDEIDEDLMMIDAIGAWSR